MGIKLTSGVIFPKGVLISLDIFKQIRIVSIQYLILD